ncbi:MAG TPA: DeoR/GlpR transcriptional regulator [Caldithrix abyssi]|uniref:DeoR/GlpR transcriptional regulator n=1 Tax=Caldithrix abyssi TaxID=187145 RepID=A0A7V4WUL6_CALAY|nr:DeoR/GlpR transcriptional regulator [Caldithrix abyssi]
MLSAERRAAIKQKVETQRRVLIQELCREFDTTPVTIRKDLDVLEKEGVLTRVHGGGILNQTIMTDLSISEKENIHLKEKERIAAFAEKLIHDRDIVILDSGFTAVHIARRLKLRSGIKIITGGLNVANEIVGSDNELVLTGGVFNKTTFGLSGRFAENVIANTVADKLFLGVDGIDLDKGLTAYNYEEAKLNSLMIHAASEVILIADSSKFGKKAMAFICGLDEIDRIITDKGIQPKYLDELNKRHIQIDVV